MPAVKFRTAAEQRASDSDLGEINREFRAILARADYLERVDSPSADEKREAQALAGLVQEYDNLLHELSPIDRTGVVAPGADNGILNGGTTGYRNGAPLTDRQTFSGYVQASGMAREEESDLSLRKYLRGAMFGEWNGAENERRAMMSLSGGADGAFLLPTPLAAQIIDLARAQTRVMQAGARIVPMPNRTLDIAQWTGDPAPEWRAEGDPIAESDGTLGTVQLSAKSLAVHTKITRELLEDASEVEDQLRRAFAAGFAKKIDAAALYGTGTDDEPTGLVATTGVTKTAVATDGASPTWTHLVDSVGRVRDANEEPTAQILANRTDRSLSKLVDTTGQYLAAPGYLDGVRRLATTAVPTNLTTGTNNDTSDVFTGDFSQLLVGVRTNLQISVLRERFMVEEGSYALVGWYRGDIAVARPAAFDIVRGVRA